MIVKGFISTKSVLEDVYRYTQCQEELPIEDLIYWCYEALGLMNQPIQFIRKVTGYIGDPDLDIQNYRAELPCDFYHLERIAVNGLPARYSGNSFHHLLSGECCGTTITSPATDIFIDNFGNQFSPQSANPEGVPVSDSITFDINNNYLTLSIQKGKVCIAYMAFPTDKEGFPMLPDDINYRVAVRQYLVQRIRYIQWSKDPSDRGKQALFAYDEKEWLWYVGKATNAAKMPHLEQMESLKNQIIRLIPSINEHDTFFANLGAKQLKRLT